VNNYYQVGASIPSGILRGVRAALSETQSRADAHIREQAARGARRSVLPLVLGGAAATVLAVMILRPPAPKL